MNGYDKSLFDILKETTINQNMEVNSESLSDVSGKKTFSEKLKDYKKSRLNKKLQKKKTVVYEGLEDYDDFKRFCVKFNKIINQNFYYSSNFGSARIFTRKSMYAETSIQLILVLVFGALLLKNSDNLIYKLLPNYFPVKQGIVVDEMRARDETIYGIDFDGNPQTVGTLLYLDNKKDTLLNNKIQIGSKIELNSYKKGTAKNIYKIDDFIVKKR